MTARILLVAALALLGAAPSQSGKALLWARGAESTTLDPAEVEWGEDAKITQNLFEPLVSFRGDTVEIEGRLAKSWTMSPDGKTLAFQLQTGVKFHDGTPFTSESVVFTFERMLDPNHPNKPKSIPYASSFGDIVKVAADGPERVVFTLKGPNAVILYNLTLFGACIVSPAAVRKFGDKFPANPVGTGPYKLARWDRDVRIVLDRFDGYWGPKPAVARVIVVPVPSPQTAIERLRKGEVHVVDHPTLADVKPLQDFATTKVDTETSMNVCYLGFNMKKFPYSDPNFRKAVSLAIDRKALNAFAYYDLADPAANLVPPAIWREACATPEYELNLEKAKEALSKVKLDSKPIELIHMTFARPYVPEPLRVAEALKNQLAKIGLDVRLSGFDKAGYTQAYKKDDHPMFLMGWNADIPDTDNFLYALLHGDSSGDLNNSFFNDPAFNDSVKAAQTELDFAKRQALYATAYARMRAEEPVVPLVHVKQVIALSRKVQYNMHPIEYRFFIASLAE